MSTASARQARRAVVDLTAIGEVDAWFAKQLAVLDYEEACWAGQSGMPAEIEIRDGAGSEFYLGALVGGVS